MSELFLPETEADAEKLATISKIHVRRMEGGKFVYCPNSFDPEALTSIEQIHDLFGGGDYMIEGRDPNGTFVKNCRFQLPGKPKPLSLSQQAEESAAQARAQQPPAAAAPAGPVLTENGMMLQLMMAQMQQTTAIITAALQRGDGASDKLFQRSQQLEDRARAEHTQFMTALLERANAAAAAPAGGNSKESFMEGMEFAQGLFQEMLSKQEAGDNPADILASIAQFVQGLGQVGKESAASGGPSVGTNGAGSS